MKKYSREQNLNSKLNDEQISEIKNLYLQGNSSRFIGERFNISHQAVLYWVHDGKIKRTKQKVSHEQNRIYFQKWRKRKHIIQPNPYINPPKTY